MMCKCVMVKKGGSKRT